MSTLAFVSPKGGAGKTTSCLVLALILTLNINVRVTIIDADPNKAIAKWSKTPNKPANLTVISDVTEDNIADRIEEAAAQSHFVLVDLEGTAAKIVLLAVGQADLVIIPTQGSLLDANEAARAIALVKSHEKTMRRAAPDYSLPYSILFTRSNPVIRSRSLKHIQDSFEAGNVPMFNAELNEREAFKALFAFNEPFSAMDPEKVPNIDKAITNAQAYASEVIATLRRKPQEA